MPKSQFINPETYLKPGYIKFKKIPVNQYNKQFCDECSYYSKHDLIQIYYIMKYIREFELALSKMQTSSGYMGISHKYRGPVHLAIGQEALSVGEAYTLSTDDIIYGSHRGHGELIAKSLFTIDRMTDDALYSLLVEYNNGAIFNEVNKSKHKNIKKLATDFILYGAFSEILGKPTGFQYGAAGSIHMFFAPFGVFPNNGIVGGSAPIATGSGLYNMIHKKPSIIVSNIGDGALGCGVVYESMNFAAMDQFKYLWKNKGCIPVLFAVSDNGYGMGGQTRGETMAFDLLARIGAGISPSQLHAERINGENPFAVIDAFTRKKTILLNGMGPALLDIVTYRFEGHSLSDKSAYRISDEISAWEKYDPLSTYPRNLVSSQILCPDEIAFIDSSIIENIKKALVSAINTPDFTKSEAKKYFEFSLFSNTRIPYPANSNIQLLENSRSDAISKKSRLDINISEALYEAVSMGFNRIPDLIAYGEDVREWGGVCGVYDGLSESLSYEKLFNSPISEATIVSSAIGYAFMGGRVIIEIMFADFLTRAADEIINQLAKWHSLSGKYFKLPIVIRVCVGSNYGAQHSQDLISVLAHIPGLKIVYPSTPYDCKGLLNRALSSDDPVLFFESRKTHNITEHFANEGVPIDYYEIEFGIPDIKRSGEHVTILTIGPILYTVITASDILSAKYAISAEVIDVRSISPLDYSVICDSVKKTSHLLIIGESYESNSIMKNMASEITSKCFSYLKMPPLVIGSSNTITPQYCCESAFYPQLEDVISNVLDLLSCNHDQN
ncbi:MAG: dehydrogenase [Christensenellaceae bacterium]|jgi:2-oxoisovalerate dehydrogenase E1 component|nr:dehydrogenase [Christensenellaceae bacterium]